MGELGSMFPVAGGLYSIVTRVLGRPIGFLALLDYIGQAIFLPASVAFGIGTYINSLYPAVSTKWVAAALMIVVALIACLDVRLNAVMIGFFLALEMGVVIMLALAGFLHMHQSLSTFTHPHMAAGTNGIGPVATSAIIAALATALFSVNGYDSAINFSEETEGDASEVGKAVVLAATIGIVFELIPFIGVLLGHRRPARLPAFRHAADRCGPLLLRAHRRRHRDVGGDPGHLQRLAGDHAAVRAGDLFEWPRHGLAGADLESAVLREPAVQDAVGGDDVRRRAGAILCAQSSLISVVTFTAVLIIILYALIAISALVSRVRQKDLERPFRMPLWPVPR